jgi:hypothetical protein
MKITKKQYEAVQEIIRLEESLQYLYSQPNDKETVEAVKNDDYEIVTAYSESIPKKEAK